jgi:glc operon protein GlcG
MTVFRIGFSGLAEGYMKKTLITMAWAAMAVFTAVNSGSASPIDLPTRPIITLSVAQKIVDAARAKADAEGWPGVICVVDSDGLPIMLIRMDNAALLAGVDLAMGKARTAALFRKPSGVLEDAINKSRPAAITARGFILMRGGLPITVDGYTVGAIGVSADTPQHDEIIAQAGLDALDAR